MMDLLKPSLFIPDQAIKFYCNVFNLTVSYSVPSENGGSSYTVLVKGNDYFCSIVPSKDPVSQDNPVQFGYSFKTEQELVSVFNQLKEGGKVLMKPGPLPYCPCAAVVTDRFGIHWFLTIPPKTETPEGWN